MDARAYVVATLFGFVGGLLVPRGGPHRTAVQATLVLMTAIGIVAWLFASNTLSGGRFAGDPFAGPSLTVGGMAAVVGTLVRHPQPET